MTKIFLILCFVTGIFIFIPKEESNSWGFYAHQRINRMAVFTLPPSMIFFYKKHIDYISTHAVDPDRRRYADPEEAPRHFFDSDHYGVHPFDTVPQSWSGAVEKFGEDSLKAHGIVPWHIEHTLRRLTRAFKDLNLDLILHYSADLGHYVADAHVPLHTTFNYNGQFTGQKGIHAFWESRIPELKANGYDYFVGRSVYFDKPVENIWKTVQGSYEAKDSVLLFEADLNSKFPSDKKWSYENRGSQLVKVYSEEYATAYELLLDHMIERRMMEAVRMTGSLWFTAWVNAGQPDLGVFDNKELSDSIKKNQQSNEELWKMKRVTDPKGHADNEQ